MTFHPFACCSFGLRFLVRHVSDVDGVFGQILRYLLVLVHVAGGDGQHAAVVGEGQAGDGRGVLVELTQSLLVQSVPDVDETVRASRRERVVVPVEGDGVDRVDLLDPVLLDAVALKRVLLLLDVGVRVQIFDGDSALDTAENVALLVRETLQATSLEFEAGLALLLYVTHAAKVPNPDLKRKKEEK